MNTFTSMRPRSVEVNGRVRRTEESMAAPTESSFESFDGTTIVFDDQGDGDVVVLLHGFAADAAVNWHAPGVTRALVEAGFRVVASDARGHGRSGKPSPPRSRPTIRRR